MARSSFRQISEDTYEAKEDILLRFGNLKVFIAKGETTDFMTAWIFKPLFKKPKYELAAAAHDILYKNKKYTRLLCDAMFYEALRQNGVHALIAGLCFIVVVCVGWTRY